MLMTRQHPSLETLAALAEGRLGGEEKMSIVDHLSQCKECYALFAATAEFVEESGEAARFQADARPETASPRSGNLPRWLGAAAAALIVVIVAVPLTQRYLDPVSQLQSRAPRPVQSRLTGFDYAPYRAMRSTVAEGDYKLLSIAAKLQAKAAQNPTPATIRQLGLAEIALGNATKAVETLTRALALDPQNAAILNDLAAAQLAAGLPADAAENAARAIEIDPSLSEAAFNWALALETLSNRPAAIKGWERYLELDPASEWSAEARERLVRLRAPKQSWERDKLLLRHGTDDAILQKLVTSYPQRIRSWVQDTLLVAALKKDAASFALAKTIAEMRALNGDVFLLDVVNSMDRNDPDVVEGTRAYSAARVAARARKMDEAAAHFDLAILLLNRAQSPLFFSASVLAATNDFYLGNEESALTRLASIEDRLLKYPSIESEAHWVRGLLYSRRGERGAALRSLRLALELAQRGRETEHEVALTSLIASELDEIADASEADRYRTEALRRLDEIGATSQRLYIAYSESGLASIRYRRPRLALAFIESQELLAREAADPLLLAESRSARAFALRDMGRAEAATDMLADARSIAFGIETAGLRDRTLAEIDYSTALMERTRNPRLAITSLSAALESWEKTGWRNHAASGRLALGDIRAAVGDTASAEGEYRSGIAEVEKERGSLEEPKLRLAYFERSVLLFDRLIQLLIKQKRFEEAFVVAERKRAREMLEAANRIDRSAESITTPLDGREIRATLHPSTTLVEFHLSDRGADIWTITRKGIHYAQSAASGDAISDSIERHRNALVRGEGIAANREARWLFQQLRLPAASEIAGPSSLVLIPDGALHSIPFAALIAPDGRYLIETFSITVAPSASFYVRHVARGSRDTRVLLVAQPSPRNLALLPQAQSDTEKLASIYPGAEIHIGDTLQPAEFLRRASSAHLISFAGHARGRALVFESPRRKDPRFLTSGEIAASSFRENPIVVLAACSTGDGRVRMTEGVDSLASAFLVAGARSVVATLWDIDDASSSQLFLALHRDLSRGKPPADALRNAQLAMLRSTTDQNRNPAAWAGMFLVGSI